jgi:hypothetical protein
MGRTVGIACKVQNIVLEVEVSVLKIWKVLVSTISWRGLRGT